MCSASACQKKAIFGGRNMNLRDSSSFENIFFFTFEKEVRKYCVRIVQCVDETVGSGAIENPLVVMQMNGPSQSVSIQLGRN